MKQYGLDTFGELAETMRRPFHDQYFAMYSSVYGGVVTDPVLMMVPVDDHIVHRGDGVFETLKCVDGSIYNFGAHLNRLALSAAELGYTLPWGIEELNRVTIETVRAGGKRDCYVRILVSRGPGSLGASPYDCPEPQLYVIVARARDPFMKGRPGGAKAGTSRIPVKPAFLARVKNCNYLHNALMKKEAVDSGLDFVVAFEEGGFLAEGSTENVGIVTARRTLLFPKPGRILPGTTMTRVVDLATPVVGQRELAGVMYADISKDDVAAASEILIVGTSPDVAAVVEFDGVAVGDGRPGPVYGMLSALLADDIGKNR